MYFLYEDGGDSDEADVCEVRYWSLLGEEAEDGEVVTSIGQAQDERLEDVKVALASVREHCQDVSGKRGTQQTEEEENGSRHLSVSEPEDEEPRSQCILAGKTTHLTPARPPNRLGLTPSETRQSTTESNLTLDSNKLCKTDGLVCDSNTER